MHEPLLPNERPAEPSNGLVQIIRYTVVGAAFWYGLYQAMIHFPFN